MQIFSARALVEDTWQKDVLVEVGETGLIERIAVEEEPSSDAVKVDSLLPAIANLHSHSFQRAMAGMTEYRAKGQDSFWTWRTLMYQFLEHLTPEHIEAIAGQVFVEMLEAGYASVGEFHYVHHQPGGTHYASQTELSDRIFAAADQTGIGLAHLPVLYSYGGAGKQELVEGQTRFGHSVDQFAQLMEALQSRLLEANPDTTLGIAPHSLRATSPDELAQVTASFGNGPVHIHIAEQPKEVADISDWLGARPVEWLLDHENVASNWCLIHATHMTETETVDFATTGAVAGLCPITESNLGDGIFNGTDFLAAGGAFGVGSDSNVRISLSEELRTLEYSQRLRDISRNLMVPGEGSVGHSLYKRAAEGGAQALSRNAGGIAVGKLADLTAINSNHPYLCALSEDQLINGFCFAADDSVVTDVWSAGRHMVKAGRHVHRDAVFSNYRTAMNDLKSKLAA
ncbi:MAG: formimidoylglutamate deiminase [Rhodobacteraceae bacterium]|nr:formimidoylglutamate deiminase [Paracoccaceae bacterium]